MPTAPGAPPLPGDILADIAARVTKTGQARALGVHLLEAAIGVDRWKRVVANAKASGSPRVTVRLWWRHTEGILGQQHWELLHDGNSFLGTAPPGVAIVRVVPPLDGSEPPGPPALIRGAPRLLFAVGTDLHEAEVRPGAEFLGLLKELDDSSRNLTEVRLLTKATRTTLARAMREFKPHALHLVCHGTRAGDQPTLEFRSDLPGQKTASLTAEQLLPTLLVDPANPPLVILSACDTARALGPEMAPFAATLVAHGVRAVVGMSGRVTDQTCRLFARRFGAALVNGLPIADAVADGRSAAFQEGDEPPDTSIDWALPSLFLAEGLDETVSAVQVPEGKTAKHRIDDYSIKRGTGQLPAFAGRVRHLEAFEAVLGAGGPHALMLYANATSVGLRRLSDELTARALRGGHVVVRVPFSAQHDYPQTLVQLLVRLLKSTEVTRRAYLDPDPTDPPAHIRDSELLLAVDTLLPAGHTLSPSWKELRSDPLGWAKFDRHLQALPPRALDDVADHLVNALLKDFTALVRAVRAHSREDPTISTHAQLWLVLPRIERWGDAKKELWTRLIIGNPQILVEEGGHWEPVRVLATRLKDGSGSDELDRLESEFRGPEVDVQEVDAFVAEEEQLAVPWVLLHPRLNREFANQVYVVGREDWHARFCKMRAMLELHALPRFFDDDRFYDVIDFLKDDGVFKADKISDQDLLAALESRR